MNRAFEKELSRALATELDTAAESRYRLVNAIEITHLLILMRDELQLKSV